MHSLTDRLTEPSLTRSPVPQPPEQGTGEQGVREVGMRITSKTKLVSHHAMSIELIGFGAKP